MRKKPTTVRADGCSDARSRPKTRCSVAANAFTPFLQVRSALALYAGCASSVNRRQQTRFCAGSAERAWGL